jgi:DNA invertase Pin-like site-specific DNA recombinase
MKTAIAVYVRVSSKQQDTKSQKPVLQRWVEAYADGMPVKWYSDHFTGKTMERKGWKALEADVEAGRIGKIVVWRLDRLGRTASGLTKLFDSLTARKVSLVSIKDGLDLATPAGRLMANVLASVAQYETEVRAERVLAGLAVARAKGVKLGGSKPGRRITVTQEQVDSVNRYRAEGMKPARIARAVGLSRPTIYRLIAETAASPPSNKISTRRLVSSLRGTPAIISSLPERV